MNIIRLDDENHGSGAPTPVRPTIPGSDTTLLKASIRLNNRRDALSLFSQSLHFRFGETSERYHTYDDK
jgi:hypothetical protein